MIRTPPICGSIALKIKANFISSCPTIAENGYGLDREDVRF
jgi:hypothetical protein